MLRYPKVGAYTYVDFRPSSTHKIYLKIQVSHFQQVSRSTIPSLTFHHLRAFFQSRSEFIDAYSTSFSCLQVGSWGVAHSRKGRSRENSAWSSYWRVRRDQCWNCRHRRQCWKPSHWTSCWCYQGCLDGCRGCDAHCESWEQKLGGYRGSGTFCRCIPLQTRWRFVKKYFIALFSCLFLNCSTRHVVLPTDPKCHRRKEAYHLEPQRGAKARLWNHHIRRRRSIWYRYLDIHRRRWQGTFTIILKHIFLIFSLVSQARLEESRTTIFQRDSTITYQLKMKNSRAVFSEVQKKAGSFPFNIRVLEDEKRARMGLQEAVQHSLIKPYEVMCVSSRFHHYFHDWLSFQIYSRQHIRCRFSLHNSASSQRTESHHVSAFVVQARTCKERESDCKRGTEGPPDEELAREQEE